MKKILLILILPLFLSSCYNMEVKDFSIKIKPYEEGEGQWKICMSAEKSSTCQGYVGFDIYKKDGKKHYIEVDFIHLKGICTDFNIFHAATPGGGWENKDYLRGWDAEDVDYILVKVWECSRDEAPIYKNKIIPTELK